MFSHYSYSSSTSKVIVFDNDFIYEQVDVFPEFENGTTAMVQYFGENLKYPQEAIDKQETAKVFVEFVVYKLGQISDVKLKREGKKYFDEAALKVISEMPNWKPGLKNGKHVNTSIVLLIIFKL